MKRILVASVSTFAVLGMVPALAQSTTGTGIHEASGFEEIVVTARKRTERLQDVPITVTALTSRELADRGMNDLFKVSQFTPGMSFEKSNRYGTQGGVSRPVIRGMSVVLGESNASVFIDGVPYSDSILSFPFDIVDRVEVIKGPQAALFGRSTFSGAINLITKRGSNDFDNKVTLKAATDENYEVNLLSRGPIVEDKLFYMAHARYYTFGGQYKNSLDGRKLGEEESVSASGSLEFRPSDNLTIMLSGGYNRDKDGLAAIALQDRFANNCFLNTPRQYFCGVVKAPDEATLDIAGLNGTEGLHRTTKRVGAVIEYNLNDFIITSNTGAFFTKSEYGHDSTYQGATAFGLLTIPNAPGAVRAPTDAVRTGNVLRNEVGKRDEWSSELRVQSPQMGAFRYLGGVFYYQKRRPLEERHFSVLAPTIDSGTDRTDNWAVFGSVGADITSNWSTSFEIRYAQDKIGNYKSATDVLIERKFKSVTPRLTTDYKLSENSMVYGTIARGNKPGVINSDPRFPVDVQFANEESSWNYEIGTKNTLLDGRMILNAAMYYIDWSKQQVSSSYFFPTGGSRSYIVNAGKTEVKGFELELSGMVSDYVTLGMTYALNDAKFVEFNDAEAFDLFGNASVAGKQLPNMSKHQMTMFGKVNYPVTETINVFARADAAYNERKYAQIYNLASTGDQYLVNLKFGVTSERWTMTFFVDNLTNDRTSSSIIRWIDQSNLNVPQHVNSNPAQNNYVSPTGVVSTTTERAFQVALPSLRQVGVTFSYNF
ncbi:TonB-dependent receptor [Govanella unica]|uniref:TonB-dependent receptor n=1 Tax=Govanella unica TaxID=2975056 RepID=A0A9X3TYR4_9PROT|nr:TonB-dependent receptor [Govania unica]MDA5194246.1 TonB-dependent receptor [Govania unica]